MDDLVQGWTDPINHVLLIDGVPLDLTGKTVALLVYDKNDVAVAYTGTVSVPDATAGKVRFSPAAADLLAANAPYKIRWRVTSAGKVAFFPNKQPWQWNVRLP